MLFQLLLLISSMYGSSNIFARSRQQNSASNSYNNNRFNSPNSSTNQPQNIGTYRVEYKDGERPSALMTSINPNWREFPPLSIVTKDKTLHLSSTELRIQDYFLIRNRKLNQSTNRHFDTALKNRCFNQELLKKECYKLFAYSSERPLDLDALRNGANRNNSPLGSRNGLNSDSNDGNSSQNNNSNSSGGYLGASRFNYSSNNNNNTSNNVFSRNSQNDSNNNNNDQYNRNNNTSQGSNIFNSNKPSNPNNQNAYNTRGNASSANIFSNQANNSNSSSNNIFNSQSNNNIFNQSSNSNNNSLSNNNNGYSNSNNGHSNNNANNANNNQNINNGSNNSNNGYSNNNNNNNPSNNIFSTKNNNSSSNNQNNQNHNNNIFNNQNNSQLSQSNNNCSNNTNYSNHTPLNNMNLNNNPNLIPNMSSNNIFGSNPYQLLKSQAMIFNGIIKEIEQRVVERINPTQTTKFNSFNYPEKNGSFFSINDPYRDPYFNLSYSKRKKQSDQTIQIFISQQDSNEKEQIYASKVRNSKNYFKNNSFLLPLESKIQNNSSCKNKNNFIQINLTKKCQSILIKDFSCDSKCCCSVKFDIRWTDGICQQNEIQIVKEGIELPSLEVNSPSSLQYLLSVLKESFPAIRSDAKIILSHKSSIINQQQVMLYGTIQQRVINLPQKYYQIFYTAIKNGELHNFTIIKKENGVKTATISWQKPIKYEFLDFSGSNVFNLQLSQVICNLPQLNSKCRITFCELPPKIKKIYKQSGKQQAIANLNNFIEKKNKPQKLFTLCSIYNDGSWTLIVQRFN